MYDSDGLVSSFAVSGGGVEEDSLRAVAVDGAGAVVSAGNFMASTATFGGVALTSAGGDDAVVWKMSAEGTTLWAVSGGGTIDESLSAVAVDGAGAVVAAGRFQSNYGDAAATSTFGGVEFPVPVGSDISVLWKLSALGTTLWAVSAGGESYSVRLSGVAVDGENAVVGAGYFSGSLAMFGDVALTATGGPAIVWKVSAEGTTLWAVRGGGTSIDSLKGVAVDGAGGVVAAGYVSSFSATFGAVVLTGAGDLDAVVWKASGEGTTLWAVRGGSRNEDAINGVAVDRAGDVLAVGHFGYLPEQWTEAPSATFGTEVLTTGAGGRGGDALLWKLSAEGTTLWAMGGGGANNDKLIGVTVDGAGAVVTVGKFNAGEVWLWGDAGLWKVSAEGTMLSAVYFGGLDEYGFGTGAYELNGVAVDGVNAVVAVGGFSSNPATFNGEVLFTAGDSDAVVWKVSDVAGFTCTVPIKQYFAVRRHHFTISCNS
jgi:hypothetical protein